jgi:hypothetical protein
MKIIKKPKLMLLTLQPLLTRRGRGRRGYARTTRGYVRKCV